MRQSERPHPWARGLDNLCGLTTIGTTEAGTLRLGTDDHGLWYEVDPPDTNAGRDLVAAVSRLESGPRPIDMRTEMQIRALESDRE